MNKYLVFCFFNAIDERDGSTRDETFLLITLDLLNPANASDYCLDYLNKKFIEEFGEEIITVHVEFGLAVELSHDIGDVAKIYSEFTEDIWQDVVEYISSENLEEIDKKTNIAILRSFAEKEIIRRKKEKGPSN